jgi:hypothetical protein
MILPAFAVLLAASASGQTPDAAVAKTLARVDALVAQEKDKDARDVAVLDHRASAQFSALAPLGWRAARPLGEAALDAKRPAKTRLFAVVFLGKLADPAAFAPLSTVLLDAGQDADLRVAAAQALTALDAPPAAARKTFCAALAEPELPPAVFDETLIALSRLGCDDGAALERAARSRGPRPQDRDRVSVLRAVTALGLSRGGASLRSLLALADYFPPATEPRAAAIAALASRRADLAGPLAAEALTAARRALLTESAAPVTMLQLTGLVDELDPADDALLPLAASQDAEVLTVAAEALARRKAVKALPVLESAAAGALDDPRFAPKPGRPDPAVLLERLQNAVESLRRARAATR